MNWALDQLKSYSRMGLWLRFERFHFHIVYYLKTLLNRAPRTRPTSPKTEVYTYSYDVGYLKTQLCKIQWNSHIWSFTGLWLISYGIMNYENISRNTSDDVIWSHALDLIGQLGRDSLRSYLLPIFYFQSEFLRHPNKSDSNLSCVFITQCIQSEHWSTFHSAKAWIRNVTLPVMRAGL